MRPTILKRASIRRTRALSRTRWTDESITGLSAWSGHEDRTYDDRRIAPTGGNQRLETDGGTLHKDDDTVFTSYTDDEYRYRIEYPAEWVAEADPPGGMFFSAYDGSSPSAFVFVDDETEVGISLDEYVEDFFGELAADEYIYAFERQGETATTLPGGQSGTVIEYTRTDDAPCEKWCCTYCFVIADGTAYTVGVDWVATDEFAGVATRIIDSFAFPEDTHSESNDR